MRTIKIRDNETGQVFDYGINRHHALRISEDGSCLTFENLQNGDGSCGGGYSFVLDDGYTPEESLSPDAMNGATYANIGGFRRDNDGWVPCSGRMPKEPGDYRVTIIEKWQWGETEYHTDFATFPGDYIDDTWDTFNDWKEGQEVHVIAWKKIDDEPYKPPAESAEEKSMREREEFFRDGE